MHLSVDRLRRILLAVAVLLVLVVAGFLGYARWRAHRFLTELPSKLGIDVRQETNAFTYSQTVKGKTVFTVHAAKAIQHKDGKYTLHDVGIAVYGHGQAPDPELKEAKQNDRVDRIYGKEFDLDQAEGIIRAVGEVHIDLEAPAAKDATGKMDYAAGRDLKPHADEAKQNDGIHEVGRGDARLIHVKTRNLVYLRKLGVAATSEEIEFEYNGLTGHAKGAEYYADTGILTLQQAVKVSGLDKGKPILLTASKAELDRTNHKITLADAKYVTVSGERNDARSRQEMQARHAVVLLRDGGGIEKIKGDSGVVLAAGDNMRVAGDRGETQLNEAGKPVSAHLTGNVTYTAEKENESGEGTSSEATVAFDKLGRAQRVVLEGNVNLNQRLLLVAKTPSPAATKQRWSQRSLTAATVEMQLVTDAADRLRPTEATARGDAKLHVEDEAADGKGTNASTMAADTLVAHFAAAANGASRLDQVIGTGKTVLDRVSEAGVHETSTGDQLEIRFQEAKANATAARAGTTQIASAVQQGHVVVTRVTPRKDNATSQTDHATAARASYDGRSQVLSLTGQVQLANTESDLWSDQLDWMQKSGDAAVRGNVKASYRHGDPNAAVHVLADNAELKKDSGIAIFHGTPRRAARLWQAGSQIEAPVIEFDQKQRNLRAHGEGDGAPMVVRTILASAAAKPSESRNDRGQDLARRSGVVRVSSREMVYSDASRDASFTGGVRVESADGVMRGDRAVVLLGNSSEKNEKKPIQSGGILSGSVERVTITGNIEIDQPGRRATGERLVYTAADGLCVLTGRQGVPPRVVDQARGIVTGDELRFRASDESVVISNGERDGAGPRVHTETRVKRDR